MPEDQTIEWPGQSGKKYKYWIYPRHQTFNTGQPGNYIHAREVSPGRFAPIYIGETDDLNKRLSNHEQQDCVDRNGATHLHVHKASADEWDRRAEEKDLILQWQPVCNTQHCS